jgi:hypothetical protein
MNLTPAGVSNFRPMPVQEPVQVAGPLTEFWAKGTGESKIRNFFLTPFPEIISVLESPNTSHRQLKVRL